MTTRSSKDSGLGPALIIAVLVLLVPGVVPSSRHAVADFVTRLAAQVPDAPEHPGQPSQSRSTAATDARTAAPVDAAAAHEQLDARPVVDRPRPDPTYDKAEFAPAGAKKFRWTDTNHNHCSTRDDVLLRDVDRTRPYRTEKQGRCPTNMVAGTWHDPYTGVQLPPGEEGFTDLSQQRQAQAVAVDHVVATAVAWRYGAKHWDRSRRIEFGNDLDNLLAVDGPTNSAKSDDDAAAWRPRKEYQCAYAARYVSVKHRYQLPVDPSEKRALVEMLTTCAGR